MTTFKDNEIKFEEEIIQKSINEGGQVLLNNNPAYYSPSPLKDLNVQRQMNSMEDQPTPDQVGIQFKDGKLKVESFIPTNMRENLFNLQSEAKGLYQGMTLKQQRSQTIQNYIEFLQDYYDSYIPKANIVAPFYPKQLKKNLVKRKNQTSDRIVHGLKAPSKPGAAKKALDQMR
jgi:hypothetical protein